jgi:cystathionine beta-lyase family protein involved in aluminum resistance
LIENFPRFLCLDIIKNATDINDTGNTLTKELIESTASLQKQFNKNQKKVLEEYQTQVDTHLKDILGYMATIIEASHINNDK